MDIEHLNLTEEVCPMALILLKRFLASSTSTQMIVSLRDTQSLSDIKAWLSKYSAYDHAVYIDENSIQLTVFKRS